MYHQLIAARRLNLNATMAIIIIIIMSSFYFVRNFVSLSKVLIKIKLAKPVFSFTYVFLSLSNVFYQSQKRAMK